MPSSINGPNADGPSHYELLQLPPSANAQELRQAFRRLSKRYHPDTTPLPADQAQEAFRRLRQAYAVLSDPQARRAYDSQRQEATTPPVAAPQPLQPLPRRLAEPKPVPVRRALSGGEWFALLLLAVALVLSMVLGIGVAWARGAELVRQPSWWPQTQAGSVASATLVNPAAVSLDKAAATPIGAPASAGLAPRPRATVAAAIAPPSATPVQPPAGAAKGANASDAVNSSANSTAERPPGIPAPPATAGGAPSSGPSPSQTLPEAPAQPERP